VGSKCEHGECIGSCSPNTSSCADTNRVRRCREDGKSYSDFECPAAMTCVNGRCESQTAASCTFGQDICLDESTALTCIRNGSGYEVKECPSHTRCRAGKCMGSVCSPGVTSCVAATTSTTTAPADFNGVQTCNADGTGYIVEVCASGGTCLQNAETGKFSCWLQECTLNEKTCTDPTGKASTEYVRRCDSTLEGKYAWTAYRCEAPASCRSNSSTGTGCHTDCSPGAIRCSSDNTAVETCDSGGNWVANKCATSTDPDLVCVVVPTTKKQVCGDKDCRSWQANATDYATRGRCSGNLIRRCGENGRLAAAIACDEGQCIGDTSGIGTCKDATRCAHDDGWRECIASNDAYRTCIKGHWEFTQCDQGEPCNNMGTGLAACGSDCIAGKSRCVGADYQICGDDATWGSSQRCSSGQCNPTTGRCESACVPGQMRCAGDVVVASDGSSYGSKSVQLCSSNNAWGAATACGVSGGEVTLCRRSGVGETLGCVQCVGSAVQAGNEEGAVDSRCNPDGHGYQVCTASNTWPATSRSCSEKEHCAKQRDGSVTGSCSNRGCDTGTASLCVGYESVTSAIAINDCCQGECDNAAGLCLHRRSHYDPTCLETSTCFTGRYDTDGNAINETCCTGFCRSGQGCLRIKAKACQVTEACSITKVDHQSICCGSCPSGTGLCATGKDTKFPFGEFFGCGSASNLCLGVNACTLQASGSTSGAMFANCIE
jgi:hypothetical protein